MSRKGEAEVAADCITLIKCAGGRGDDFSFVDPQSDNVLLKNDKLFISHELRKTDMIKHVRMIILCALNNVY